MQNSINLSEIGRQDLSSIPYGLLNGFRKMKIRSSSRLSDADFRRKWISESAYYKAERRYFAPGHDVEDWRLAEKEFVEMLIKRYLDLSNEDGGMTIKGLQRLAKSIGIETAYDLTAAVDLIHAIQTISHDQPCFNVDPGTPCNTLESCIWKVECKKLVAKWKPL